MFYHFFMIQNAHMKYTKFKKNLNFLHRGKSIIVTNNTRYKCRYTGSLKLISSLKCLYSNIYATMK